MIYLFDNKQRLTSVIRKEHIMTLLYERERNGLYTLSAEVPVTVTDKRTQYNHHKKINKASFVGHYDRNGRFQLHRISAVDVEDNNILLKGVHIFFDEAKAGTIIKDKRFVDKQALDGVKAAFNPLGWYEAEVDSSPYRTYNFYNLSPLEARQKLIDTFGYEFDYWVDFDGKQITNRRLTFKKTIGKDTNKRYVYGHNVLSIKAEQDYSEIYTAVIGRGRGEGQTESGAYGNRLEFTNVEWTKPSHPLDKSLGERILIDPIATEKFGYFKDGVMQPRIKVVVFEDIEKASELIEESYRWLMNNNVPKAVFSLNIPDGDGNDLGDTVYVIYRDIELVRTARVSKTLDDLLTARRSVEFGDSEYFETDKRIASVSSEVKRVEADSKVTVSKSLETLKAEFDAKFDAEVAQMFNEYDQALADARQRVDEMDARLTKLINDERNKLANDIEAAKGMAMAHADAQYAALSNDVNTKLDETKTKLSNDITVAIGTANAHADAGYADLQKKVNTRFTDETNRLSANISAAQTAAEAKAVAEAQAVKTSIDGKLTAYQSNTDAAITKIVGGDVNNLTTSITKIVNDVNAKANQTTLTSLESDLRSRIDLMNVAGFGNRNMLTNSLTRSGFTAGGTSKASTRNELPSGWEMTYSTAQKIKVTFQIYNSMVAKPFEVGKNYTVSVTLLSTVPLTLDVVSYRGALVNTTNPVTLLANVPKRVSFTVAMTSTNDIVVEYTSRETATFIGYSRPKIEEGTTATDWVPAWTDTDSSYSSTQVQIQQLTDRLSSKVDTSTYNALNDKVAQQGNEITQTKDSVTTLSYKADANTQNIAKLEQTATGLSSSVTELNDWKTVKGTLFQQTADQVQTFASRIDANDTKIASVKQTADSVSTTVASLNDWRNQYGSTFEQTANKVQASVWKSDINAMQVSSRNLLQASMIDTATLTAVNNSYKRDGKVVFTKNTSTASFNIKPGILPVSTRHNIRFKYKVTAGTLTNLILAQTNLLATINRVTVDGVDKGTALGSIFVANDTKEHIVEIFFTTSTSQNSAAQLMIRPNYPLTTSVTMDIYDISMSSGDKTLIDWIPPTEEMMRHTDLVLRDDGFLLGTTLVGGNTFASAIVGSPSGLELIGNNVNVSNNLSVQNMITTRSIEAVEANIPYIKTSILTAGAITSDMLQSEVVQAQHLKVDDALINKLVANAIYAKMVETQTMNAVDANIGHLSASILTSNVITSEMLQSDVVTADKLKVDEALINKLVADEVFAKAITAGSVTAIDANIGKLTTAFLDSLVITTEMLEAEVVTADKLKVDQALFDKLIAGTILADEIKAKTMEVVHMNAGEITTLILNSEVITAEHIKVDQALMEKMYANEALISTLTSKEAFIRDVKAIEITADKINGGILASLDGGMYWDLNTGQFRSRHTTWVFEQPRSALLYQKDGVVAGMHFNVDTDNNMPVAVIGTSSNRGTDENPSLDDNEVDFVGIRAFSGRNEIDMIGNSILLRQEAGRGTENDLSIKFDLSSPDSISMSPFRRNSEGEVTLGTSDNAFDTLYVNEIQGGALDAYALAEEVSTIYATQESLSNYVLNSDIEDVVRLSDLDSYALLTDLDSYVLDIDLESYALKTDLDDFVSKNELEAYAKTSVLSDYAKVSSLSDFAKKIDLDAYIKKSTSGTEINGISIADKGTVIEFKPSSASDSILFRDSDYGGLEIANFGTTSILRPWTSSQGPHYSMIGEQANPINYIYATRINGIQTNFNESTNTGRLGSASQERIEFVGEKVYIVSGTKKIALTDLLTKLGV